jgi:hypothetical protein
MAERERAGDLAWIRQSLHIFWPAVQQGHAERVRGAIFADTTSRAAAGNAPF